MRLSCLHCWSARRRPRRDDAFDAQDARKFRRPRARVDFASARWALHASGQSSNSIEARVGWAKARVRRAHHASASVACDGGHATLSPPYPLSRVMTAEEVRNPALQPHTPKAKAEFDIRACDARIGIAVRWSPQAEGSDREKSASPTAVRRRDARPGAAPGIADFVCLARGDRGFQTRTQSRRGEEQLYRLPLR